MTTQEIRGLVYDFLTGCGGNTPAQIAVYIDNDDLIDEMLENMTLTREDIERVHSVWDEVLDEVKAQSPAASFYGALLDRPADRRQPVPKPDMDADLRTGLVELTIEIDHRQQQ